MAHLETAKCSVFTVSFDTAGFSNLGRWTSLFNDTQHQFKIHCAKQRLSEQLRRKAVDGRDRDTKCGTIQDGVGGGGMGRGIGLQAGF